VKSLRRSGSQTVYKGITATTPLLETLIDDPADSVNDALRLDAGTRTTIRARQTWTRTALAALAVSVALLAGGVSSAAAAPAATAAPTDDCWLRVVNDWLDNNRVDGVYAIPCYTQAIQHLNAYPDVQNYSSATDDIQRALLAAIRQDRGNGPGAGPGPQGPTSGPSAAGPGKGPTSGSPGKPSSGVLGSFSPSDAQSIPLPLLVLGGLALLLLVAAGATLVARRIQARRGPSSPTRTPAVDKRG
jgi:hypothetical protein